MLKPGHRQVQPSNEISHFTNRDDQRARFHHHLSSETEPPVLTFYGVGGNGKSWLLKKLRTEVPAEIPSAFLDFDVPAGGHRFALDPPAALYEIRQQLNRSAPRFDLAFAMLRYKQGLATEGGHWLIDLASELAGTWTPGAGTVLKWLSQPIIARLKHTPLERFLANATGTQLALELRARTSQEIGDKLFEYLAEDLRESLEPHLHHAVRAVLFFDTFEALAAGLQNEEHQRLREQWVREVASNFDFALTVIAGQNRLTWDEVDCNWSEHLDQHLIGGLSETDARRFLADFDIGGELQDSILATSQETDGDGYHCYSLGLCADIVAAERRKGQEPVAETLRFRPQDWETLARRFLKSLRSDSERRWIERLAVTPRRSKATMTIQTTLAAFALCTSVAAAQQFGITTFAGAPLATMPVAALQADIGDPKGIAVDTAGTVYFTAVGAVLKLDRNGILTRMTGTVLPSVGAVVVILPYLFLERQTSLTPRRRNFI